MDVFEAIKNRRSIRQYKPDSVDDKTIEKVLEAAHWAPSWANQQCWRFVIVRDVKIKSEIADTLNKVTVDNEPVANAAATSIQQAPILIVLCAEKGKAGYGVDGSPQNDKGEYWYMFDIALAMQNLTLAAHALGLGTVIVGGFNIAKVEKILGVPNTCTVVTMTPLGVPDHKGQVSPRKQLSEVIIKDKFS
ncbi:MAG: nitroreductase family protein [Candidatus Omnitrophica bacterium]|nr:nitroreductase family protein [Candidatus Omnitrophota bacterium]